MFQIEVVDVSKNILHAVIIGFCMMNYFLFRTLIKFDSRFV